MTTITEIHLTTPAGGVINRVRVGDFDAPRRSYDDRLEAARKHARALRDRWLTKSPHLVTSINLVEVGQEGACK